MSDEVLILCREYPSIKELCLQVLGDDILSSLSRIPDPQSSELVPFVRKLVSSGEIPVSKSSELGPSVKKTRKLG